MRKFINTPKVIAIAILILAAANVYSQVNKIEIVIDKQYDPTVKDAKKVSFNPKLDDSLRVVPQMNYMIYPKKVETSFTPASINPAKISGYPLPKLYKSLFKAGMGTYATPLFEFSMNTLRSSKHSLGVDFHHQSSSATIENKGFSGYSENYIKLHATRFLEKSVMNAGMGFNRDVVHYYGYDALMYKDITKDSTRQRYSRVNAHIGFNSNTPDSNKLRYSTRFNFLNTTNLENTSENCITLNGNLSKGVKWIDKKKGELFNLGIDVNSNYLTDTAENINSSTVVGMYPTLTLNFKDVKITGGLKGMIAADSSSRMKLFPVLDVDLHVAGNIIIVYGGLDGGYKQFTFNELTAENPFLAGSPKIGIGMQKIGFHGGIRGLISTPISFDLRYSNSTWENMPFFVNDTISTVLKKFMPVYAGANIARFHAEILYHQWEKFRVLAYADFDTYSKMDGETQPWMKPDKTAGLNGLYNLKDKILVRANIAYVGARKARVFGAFGDPDKQYIQLKPYMDLSIGLEYRYSKILSIFLNANNTTGNRYYRWIYYPSQRFSILGGFTYAL